MRPLFLLLAIALPCCCCLADDAAARPGVETLKKRKADTVEAVEAETTIVPGTAKLRAAIQIVADTGKPATLTLPKGVRVTYGYSRDSASDAINSMWRKHPPGSANLGWVNAKGKKGHWAMILWADRRKVDTSAFRQE